MDRAKPISNNHKGFLIQELDRKLSSYFFGNNKLIDTVATIVFAGYLWAKHGNFDDIIHKEGIIFGEKHDAEELLKRYYSNKSIKYIIEEMINKQAEVIWLRRRKGGNVSDEYYERDKWEAKRYVAYLFFEELLRNCVDKHSCPDFSKGMDKEILTLLKSLSVEEYCRIRGYLNFRERSDSNGFEKHGYDQQDYLDAMAHLDCAFKNCKETIRNTLSKHKHTVFPDRLGDIITAKINPSDRLGPIDQEAVELFVRNFYGFVEDLYENTSGKEDAIKVLRGIYSKDNAKIINMVEFITKCIVAAHVEKDTYKGIRIISGKL